MIGLVVVLPAAASAQPAPGPQKEDASIPKLELARDAAVAKGQVAAVQGTVDGRGVRYSVAGLSILQPVVVTLLARDESDDLTLSLFKHNWTEPRRNGSTRGKGIASFEFRTEGSLNVLVRSESEARPFALVVWAGDELRPPMRDIVVTTDEHRKRNRGGTAGAPPDGPADSARFPVVVWIVIAALTGAAALLFARRLFNRRQQP